MSRSIALAALAMACALPVAALAQPAQAQTTAPRDVTFTLGAATDYRSKGVSKTDDQGYAFAAADWRIDGGPFYVGTTAATVDTPFGASYEVDLKAGVRTRAASWDLDFTAFYRVFPDSNAGVDDDYVEARAQASRTFDAVTVRALVWYTPDNVAAPEASIWSEARATWRVTPRIRAGAALGYHSQENGADYAAWNAGMAFDLARNVEVDLRWYDTDGHRFGPRNEGEAVAALQFKF